MPLNKKGKKIKKAMVKQYGKKKGESVFYAMENSGKIKKVKKLSVGGGRDASQDDFGGGSKSSGDGNGRNPSKQYEGKTSLSPGARQALQDQRDRARGRISPSTTPTGNVLKGIGVLGFGMPTQITGSIIDRSPMAFGVPKSTKNVKENKSKTSGGVRTVTRPNDGNSVNNSVIAGPISIAPQPIKRRGTVSPTGRFDYTVGLRKGGLLRQGKPKLTKKGWK